MPKNKVLNGETTLEKRRRLSAARFRLRVSWKPIEQKAYAVGSFRGNAVEKSFLS